MTANEIKSLTLAAEHLKASIAARKATGDNTPAFLAGTDSEQARLDEVTAALRSAPSAPSA